MIIASVLSIGNSPDIQRVSCELESTKFFVILRLASHELFAAGSWHASLVCKSWQLVVL